MLKGKCQANQDAWVTLEEGRESVPSRSWDKRQRSVGKVAAARWGEPWSLGLDVFYCLSDGKLPECLSFFF